MERRVQLSWCKGFEFSTNGFVYVVFGRGGQ
jgi:hypothetical protein